jgi:ssDNA-binding Zn-finger/Zn-ribbon topoisomerase 1
MLFADYLAEFQTALSDEISALRKGQGRQVFMSDGHRLARSEGKYIYSFTADSELRFPDQTPADLVYRGKKRGCVILSVEGFEIVLGMEEDIGDSIAIATLLTEPWFLLEQLQQRLIAANSIAGSNRSLAERLLSETASVAQTNLSQTQRFLDQMGLGATDYNEHQLLAVDRVLHHEVSFVWGPPGTGKTKTLGIAVAALAQAGESVLVVAHSNSAVDVAMQSVAQNLQNSPYYRNGMVLRYGAASREVFERYSSLDVRGIARQEHSDLVKEIERLEEQKRKLMQQSRKAKLTTEQSREITLGLQQVREALEPLKAELREVEAGFVQKAHIVGCTFSKAVIAAEIYDRRFDAIVVDEASMAYIPHCVFVSTLARRRISVFGDFRQLAPISQSTTDAAERWLQQDIFGEAGIVRKVRQGIPDSRLVLLKTQYRMHPDIAIVPNQLFYDGQLATDSGVVERTSSIAESLPGAGEALVFRDLTKLSAFCRTEKQSKSRFNLVSAIAAIDTAYRIVQTQNLSVGIITPYNAQARLINRLLRDTKLLDLSIKAATVHSFQGSEQNIIIFDAVDGKPKRQAGVLLRDSTNGTSMRLANVAITRAQGKFIALVNDQYLSEKLLPSSSFYQLMTQVKAQGDVESLSWASPANSTGWMPQLPGMQYFSNHQAAKSQIEADLQQAKEEIAISWSTRLTAHHFSAAILRSCRPSVRFFITGQGCCDFAQIGLENTKLWDIGLRTEASFVGIDREILWVYLNPRSSSNPVLRLEMAATVKLLYAFCRLIPDDELKRETLTERSEADKSPIGNRCLKCGNSTLWLQSGRYGAYLACTVQGCGYTKPIRVREATELARFMGLKCDRAGCGGQIEGRKRRSDGGIFLGCTNYPRCDRTYRLEDLI